MTVASASLLPAALAAALLAQAGTVAAQSPPAPGEATALPSPEAEAEARQRQEAVARERAEQAARRKARLEKAARDKAEAEKAEALRREKALLAPPVAVTPPPVAAACQGSVQRSGTVIEIGLTDPCVDLAGIGAVAFRSGGAPIVTLALPSPDDRIGELSTLIKSTPGLARESEPAGRFGLVGLDRWLGWGAALIGWLLFGLSLGTQVARRRMRPAGGSVAAPAAVTAPLAPVPDRPIPLVPFSRSPVAPPAPTLAALPPARSAAASSSTPAGWGGSSRCPGTAFLAEYNAVLADPGRLDGFIAAHGFVAVSGDSAASMRIDAGRSAKDSPLWGIVAGDDLWVMPGWYLYHKRANLTGINFSAAQTRYGHLFELRQGPGFDLQRPARLRRAPTPHHVVAAPGLLVLG